MEQGSNPKQSDSEPRPQSQYHGFSTLALLILLGRGGEALSSAFQDDMEATVPGRYGGHWGRGIESGEWGSHTGAFKSAILSVQL